MTKRTHSELLKVASQSVGQRNIFDLATWREHRAEHVMRLRSKRSVEVIKQECVLPFDADQARTHTPADQNALIDESRSGCKVIPFQRQMNNPGTVTPGFSLMGDTHND